MDENTLPAQPPALDHPSEPWQDHAQPAGAGEESGLVARAGSPRDADEPAMVSRDGIIEALKTVFDPEIPVNIYELGLVYELDVNETTGDAKVVMTLTAPGCPVAGILPQQVADACAGVPGTGRVEVYLVWDPPWDMEKMSEEAKLALGYF
jgi:FeS assembly SUF system protein